LRPADLSIAKGACVSSPVKQTVLE
jgi:hypothetical protein